MPEATLLSPDPLNRWNWVVPLPDGEPPRFVQMAPGEVYERGADGQYRLIETYRPARCRTELKADGAVSQ